MSDIYYTIKKEGEGLIREKMSRFLSFAIHVESVDEAMTKVKEFQNRFHDARHVCWAYMIGPKRDQWQLNDNGEPSGTAGKPILGQINSKGLTDVLVLVVRYFGGIKLGTSGLIIAYREAAKMALEEAEIVECHEMKDFNIEFAYEDMDGIMRVIKAEEVEVVEKYFDNICRMQLRIREGNYDKVEGMLSGRGARIENIEK